MSLIGIDVGSSSTKLAAYSQDGTLLAMVREAVTPRRPQPGWWELEPEEVWEATREGLRRLAGHEAVRHDPPRALAISASGREAFPLDSKGKVLGPCIMAGDMRTYEFAGTPIAELVPEEWLARCGHTPERMDPISRLLWWRRNRPDIMSQAQQFLGWHEFITLRLSGQAVTDRSLAGKWLVYELAKHSWSEEWLAKLDIDPKLLPVIQPWGTVMGTVRPELASDLGLPANLKIGIGAFDLSCAALGSGVPGGDAAGLASGSWEDLIVPTARSPRAAKLIKAGFSVGPQPGNKGLAVFALSPNGTAALDWARDLLNVPLEDLDARLKASGPGPSPLLAMPHLSGATWLWEGRHQLRGAFLGLSLATSPLDMVKALMEAIAYELFYAFEALQGMDLKFNSLRAFGGGSRSAWWTQLKADLMGVPIQVVNQPEPGTLGAALLAGLAVGDFTDLEQGAKALVALGRNFEPNKDRNSLHQERLAAYQRAVASLAHLDWQKLAN